MCYGWVPQKINKYGLITDGYGIVNEDDLADDIKSRRIRPYNPSKWTFSIYWQCVPVSEVTPMYRTWEGEDGMGLADVVVTLCELEIRLKNRGELHIYADRRAHEVSVCKNFMKHWAKFTYKEKIVCLNGELPSYHQNEKKEKYVLWTWNKFKTKKGCYAYFGGVDCGVTEPAKQEKNLPQKK